MFCDSITFRLGARRFQAFSSGAIQNPQELYSEHRGLVWACEVSGDMRCLRDTESDCRAAERFSRGIGDCW